MRFLVTADLHCHNHQAFATYNGDGVNERLLDSLGVIGRMADYAEEYGITRLVIAGDLFDKRTAVQTDVLHLTFEAILAVRRRGLSPIIITGNHDQFLRNGRYHATAVFQNMALVVDTPQVTMMEEVAFMLCPFIDDMGERKAALGRLARAQTPGADRRILIAHTPIDDGFVGSFGDSEVMVDQGVEVADLVPEAYDLAILGDYHQAQALTDDGQVFYVGSPLQLDRGESGEKGFWEVEASKGKVNAKMVPVDAPRFVDAVPGGDGVDAEGNFVTAVIPASTPRQQEERLRKALMAQGARAVRIERKAGRAEVENRLGLTLDMTVEQMMGRYVRSFGWDGGKTEEYLGVGMELVGGGANANR